jgi:hypothetical protein
MKPVPRAEMPLSTPGSFTLWIGLFKAGVGDAA